MLRVVKSSTGSWLRRSAYCETLSSPALPSSTVSHPLPRLLFLTCVRCGVKILKASFRSPNYPGFHQRQVMSSSYLKCLHFENKSIIIGIFVTMLYLKTSCYPFLHVLLKHSYTCVSLLRLVHLLTNAIVLPRHLGETCNFLCCLQFVIWTVAVI